MCALSRIPAGPTGARRRDIARAYLRVLEQTRTYDDTAYVRPLAQVCAALRARGLQVVELGSGVQDALEGAWARIEADGDELAALYRAAPGATRMALLALIHEFAHVILHWRKKPSRRGGAARWSLVRRDEALREVEAELATCVVAEHLGIPHPGGADYVLAWQGTSNETEWQARRRATEAAEQIIAALATSWSDALPRAAPRRRASTGAEGPGGHKRPSSSAVRWAQDMFDEMLSDPHFMLEMSHLPDRSFQTLLELNLYDAPAAPHVRSTRAELLHDDAATGATRGGANGVTCGDNEGTALR
jgi:hypothetical protein